MKGSAYVHLLLRGWKYAASYVKHRELLRMTRKLSTWYEKEILEPSLERETLCVLDNRNNFYKKEFRTTSSAQQIVVQFCGLLHISYFPAVSQLNYLTGWLSGPFCCTLRWHSQKVIQSFQSGVQEKGHIQNMSTDPKPWAVGSSRITPGVSWLLLSITLSSLSLWVYMKACFLLGVQLYHIYFKYELLDERYKLKISFNPPSRVWTRSHSRRFEFIPRLNQTEGIFFFH